MDAEFINITTENLAQEHLCCIIRSKKPHPGIDAKRQWLSDRLKEGHVFRKLNAAKATVFIEYAPLETAWVPIIGDNFTMCTAYGFWAAKKEKDMQSADGVLLGRGQETGEIRRLYAWIEKTEGLAF